ncbi:hypothetical protein [Actinoplanes aureus]|uniref:Uncharacterized protein n=1 Tax=Actinoplanes aureus TaxID=2792083 RepID=A0A931CDA6_9ACTN|nr:hypothetical protein [Actinoplanes aureus]MBG0562795.1 hypothetical protein [Actinoplanes aureus]
MLKARRTSMWRNRYEISNDATPIAVWDGNSWTSGGRFELDGHAYRIGANGWGTRYTMTDSRDAVLAEAERVGRKQWRVHAGGRTYEFKRDSLWRGSDEQLMDGETVIGRIKRTSAWRGDVAAELPGLPLPVQIFVLGVVVTNWNNQAAAAA